MAPHSSSMWLGTHNLGIVRLVRWISSYEGGRDVFYFPINHFVFGLRACYTSNSFLLVTVGGGYCVSLLFPFPFQRVSKSLMPFSPSYQSPTASPAERGNMGMSFGDGGRTPRTRDGHEFLIIGMSGNPLFGNGQLGHPCGAPPRRDGLRSLCVHRAPRAPRGHGY